MVVVIHACFAGRLPVLQSLPNVSGDPGSHAPAEFAHMMHERSGKIFWTRYHTWRLFLEGFDIEDLVRRHENGMIGIVSRPLRVQRTQ